MSKSTTTDKSAPKVTPDAIEVINALTAELRRPKGLDEDLGGLYLVYGKACVFCQRHTARQDQPACVVKTIELLMDRLLGVIRRLEAVQSHRTTAETSRR